MTAHVGMMVQYRWRPGQVRAGQGEAAAIITRVRKDDCCDLRIYVADSHDALLQQNVMPMSQEVQHHCWRPLPGGDVEALRVQVEQLTADLVAAHERIDALEGGKAKAAQKPKALV